MIDTVIAIVEGSILALFALAGYLFLVGSFLPNRLLRPVLREDAKRARGAFRVVFEGGRGVVCEPDLRARRYLYQYASVQCEGRKFLRCRVNPRIHSLSYEVASLGRGGELLDLVTVHECPVEAGVTRPVPLPSETARVYVILRRVDSMYEDRTPSVRYEWRGMLLTVALTTLGTIAAAWILREAILRIGAVCLPSAQTLPLVPVLLLSGGLGLLVGAWAVLCHTRLRGRRLKG